MFDFLVSFCERPEPFSRSTIKTLWTQKHLAEQMLNFHLSQDTQLASRSLGDIDRTVQWIDDQVSLSGKRLCDLGCGPGLYTERFHALGANVTGIDFSARSLQYATEHSAGGVCYVEGDYIVDELPDGFDIVTLIYTDFCVLGPEQRALLLTRIRTMLNKGGRLVLDVVGLGQLDQVQETTIIEQNLMNGFWSASDYVGIQKTLIYAEEAVSLDRYAIIELGGSWEIYNWYQYYSPESITQEMQRSGFEITHLVGGLSGAPLEERSALIGVIAKPV